jgi:arabinofuranosyltransferase
MNGDEFERPPVVAGGATNRRHWLALVALVGVLIVHARYLAGVTEDAHITFRFARHVADGLGFVWNVGEPPIEGFTTLLWLMLSAGAIKAGIDEFALTQALGVASACGTLILTFFFARRLLSARPGVALVPCILLAASGPHAAWAMSAMETSSCGLFILLGTFAYLMGLQTGARKWPMVSACALCVATVLRPEGAMVFGVLVILSVILFGAPTRANFSANGVAVLIYLAPLAALEAWRLHVFHDPLPNTAYAKTGGSFHQYIRGIKYLVHFSYRFVLPLLPVGIVYLWNTAAPDGPHAKNLAGRLLASARQFAGETVCLAMLLAYFAYVAYVGGDYMAMYRFMVPVLPFLYLLVVPVLRSLEGVVPPTPHKRRVIAGLVLLAAGGTLIQSTPLEGLFFTVPPLQHGTYRGIQAERWNVARLALIGRFFRRYTHDAPDSLATGTIGAPGYYAPNLVIEDLNGLTDKYIAHRHISGMGRGWPGHEKMDLDYSFGRLPTFFMLDRNLAENDILPVSTSADAMANALEKTYVGAKEYASWIRKHPDFIAKNYRLVTILLDDPVNAEKGYFAFLENKHRAQGTSSPN